MIRSDSLFRYLKMPVLILSLLLCMSSIVFAKNVIVEGYGASRDAAIHDALRQAVEETIGTLVDSQIIVQNNSILQDEVYTKSQGFVSDYSVLSTRQNNSGVVVKVKVTVDTEPNSKLMTKLQRLNIIDIALRDPRIGVIIPDMSVETAIIDKLNEAGFKRILDSRQLANIRSSDIVQAVVHGDLTSALNTATSNQLDYLIIGEAFSEYAGSDAGYNIKSCRAWVEAKLIKVDTGEIIAAQDFQSSGIDITESNAAKKSLHNAGELAGKFFVNKFLAYASNPEKGLQIKIININNFNKVNTLERSLKQIRGVTNVFIREYKTGTVLLDINYSGTNTAMISILENLETVHLNVLKTSNSVILATLNE